VLGGAGREKNEKGRKGSMKKKKNLRKIKKNKKKKKKKKKKGKKDWKNDWLPEMGDNTLQEEKVEKQKKQGTSTTTQKNGTTGWGEKRFPKSSEQ